MWRRLSPTRNPKASIKRRENKQELKFFLCTFVRSFMLSWPSVCARCVVVHFRHFRHLKLNFGAISKCGADYLLTLFRMASVQFYMKRSPIIIVLRRACATRPSPARSSARRPSARHSLRTTQAHASGFLDGEGEGAGRGGRGE